MKAEILLLDRFIKENENKLKLSFEKGRLNQMLRDNPEDQNASDFFLEGAKNHFHHNCASEVIKQKLASMFHVK